MPLAPQGWGTSFEAAPAKRGGDRKSKSTDTASFDSQIDRASSNGVGIVTQRWLDRLARDRPDLLDKVQAGELKDL